ncbi:MAG: DUF5689 domain-containing protein [Adhaeribacter sp.]
MKNKLYTWMAVCASALAFTSCLQEDPNWAEGQPSPIISIEDVRDIYRGAEVTLTPDNLAGAHTIVGVVTSDAAGKNLPDGTFVIQNRRRNVNRAMIVSLGAGATVPYLPGDSLVIDIAGAKLIGVNGSLRLTGLTPEKITKAGENKTVRVTAVTIDKMMNNPNAYEGLLVRVAGSLNPLPISGETYSGNKTLEDGSGTLTLHTEAGSTMASRRLPASASFTGIVIRDNANGSLADSASLQLWVRNPADVTNASGPIYAGWPENFDSLPESAKKSYNSGDNLAALSTGSWYLYQSILGDLDNDRAVSAPNAIRIQQNLSVPGLLQMNFDVPNGATKVTAWVGSYGAASDKPAQWRLEYSQDQGTTWTQIGEDKWAISKTKELITFLMNIEGPVRFRIYKYGPGSGSTNASIQNGRLSIDDFAIYSN